MSINDHLRRLTGTHSDLKIVSEMWSKIQNLLNHKLHSRATNESSITTHKDRYPKSSTELHRRQVT